MRGHLLMLETTCQKDILTFTDFISRFMETATRLSWFTVSHLSDLIAIVLFRVLC